MSPPLPSHIVRLTAPNAGPFTGTGTNTYVVGHDTLAVIDPGPADPAHIKAILAQARGRPISHILLTHAHRDHADAIPALVARTGAATMGYGRIGGPTTADPAASPSGGDFVAHEFVPTHALAGGSSFDAGDVRLSAIHTPGHAPDHLCFALGGETPLLFSGDHVMGWSTSVIAPPEGHMGHYLASLDKLLVRPETIYLPGHGDFVADGPRTARAYLLHRQMRERSVLDAVRDGAYSLDAVTDRVYAGLAANLRNAARLSVLAHAELLREKGLLVFDNPSHMVPLIR